MGGDRRLVCPTRGIFFFGSIPSTNNGSKEKETTTSWKNLQCFDDVWRICWWRRFSFAL